MPCTMNVNYLTVVHKKSTGIAVAFPDVCKTPSPGGPIPIPYPNIAMSSNAAKTTKKVKVDGEGVMVKGSNFSMSSGDEAGTLFGVISNKVKGKAEFLNYSFDVKFEGKAVGRLLDPMGNNCGSNLNTVTPAEAQAPLVVLDMSKVGVDQFEACEKLEEKKVADTPEAQKAAAEKAGMVEEDYHAIRDVCADNNATVSFRDTNPACLPHLKNGVPSKGHDTLTKTFDASNLDDANKDLAGLVSTLDAKPPKGELIDNPRSKIARKNGKPLTGDYDMNDIITSSNGNRVRGGSKKENRLIERFNAAIPGDQPRVMHGAQANYGDYLKTGGKGEKPIPGLFQPGIDVDKGEGLTVFDGKSRPADVYRLETHEDVANLYRCKGTNMPREWNMREGAESGKKFKSKVKK